MAKGGKGKKNKSTNQAKKQVSSSSSAQEANKENGSTEINNGGGNKGYYWQELRRQACILRMNQMINRPYLFSYFSTVPMSAYTYPIGVKGEEKGKPSKKGKKKK